MRDAACVMLRAFPDLKLQALAIREAGKNDLIEILAKVGRGLWHPLRHYQSFLPAYLTLDMVSCSVKLCS